MKNKWMDFKKARKFARKLGLKEYRDWKKYCLSGKKPKNIPAHPSDYKEWIDVYDWLGTNRERRRYRVNDKFFSKWSHNMAYVLGLWFSDGHIIIKTNMGRSRWAFIITQHTKDRYLLEKISRIMDSSYPVRKAINPMGSPYSQIHIRSEQIVKDIIELGGKERKSLDIKFPKVPKKYLSDFIRGLWDGDGSVFYGRQNDGKLHGGASLLSGSKDFIQKMMRIMKVNIRSLHGNIYQRVSAKNNNTYYCIYFSINNARRLRNFMYKNKGLKLRRKYLVFKQLGEISV